MKTVNAERRAALAAGPQVCNVAEAWQQHPISELSPAKVAANLGLTEHDVEAALAYWVSRCRLSGRRSATS